MMMWMFMGYLTRGANAACADPLNASVGLSVPFEFLRYCMARLYRQPASGHKKRALVRGPQFRKARLPPIAMARAEVEVEAGRIAVVAAVIGISAVVEAT